MTHSSASVVAGKNLNEQVIFTQKSLCSHCLQFFFVCFFNRVTRHQTDDMVCCTTALFNSIRVFHDNQLGSTPWISPGAYNHHTPSAQTGTGEPHPPVARTLHCNITGPLGATKRRFLVYFKAFYYRLCYVLFFPLALGSVLNVDFSPFKFNLSAPFPAYQGFTACLFYVF